jgi:hypothetical protein
MAAAAPFASLHVDEVIEVDTFRIVGCVMSTNAEEVQPSASVTATAYVPAARDVALLNVPPAGSQSYT